MKNKIFKYIGLEVLLLLALMLCGTIVVKIFNVALKLQFESIGTTGFIGGWSFHLKIENRCKFHVKSEISNGFL